MLNLPISLFDRLDLEPHTGCWNWIGTLNKDGYGETKYQGKKITAHRLAAHLWLNYDVGNRNEFPLHKCDNRKCWNPKHLFIGTRGDNILDCVAKGRQWQQKKTHCVHGHEFTSTNTGAAKSMNGRQYRLCLTCRRDKNERSRVVSSCLTIS